MYGNGELPNGGWIPVSHGLPKESDTYMVTIKSRPDLEPYTYTAFYDADDKKWSGDIEPCNEYDLVPDITDKVIAWMPLPEPYKSTDSEMENKE